MRDRWGGLLQVDPAYSPNLDLDHAGFDLADRPRVLPSWIDWPAASNIGRH